MRDWKWSPQEKRAARRAFDIASGRALADVLRQAKERAERLAGFDDLGRLEQWLGERRRELADLLDFRYSVLPMVLARMLSDGLLSEAELTGLDEEKRQAIRMIAGLDER